MDYKMTETNMKKAFTMAETLLTIMIIGVLMALMLRTINRVNPDKDKLLFLKSYHAAENAIANTINDASKYDPTYYTEAQRATLTDGHLDFRYAPYPTAIVTYTTSTGAQATKSPVTLSTAVCYFMADQMNTIGAVNCENNGGIDVGEAGTVAGVNFRTSNGVCFNNWSGYSGNSHTGKIDTDCDGTGIDVTVFYDGKMTVPPGTAGTDQNKAYNWLQKQAEIK